MHTEPVPVSIVLLENPDRVSELLAVEEECFAHPLNENQLHSLLRESGTLFLGAEQGGVLVGSIWVQTVLDEGYIGNVAVRPSWRRQGVADAMLKKLTHLAEERKLSFLTLEVRAGNIPAISLYTKHGYDRVGMRPGYYTDPREDAILMTKHLKPETNDRWRDQN